MFSHLDFFVVYLDPLQTFVYGTSSLHHLSPFDMSLCPPLFQPFPETPLYVLAQLWFPSFASALEFPAGLHMPLSLCILTLRSPVFKGPSCICCTLGLILPFYLLCALPLSCAHPLSYPDLDFVCPLSPSDLDPGGLWVSPSHSTQGSSVSGPLYTLCSQTVARYNTSRR